jgi:putative solute:sodium symporter small subunit
MENPDKKFAVNLFRPKSAHMKGEVLAILFILLLWGLASFGFQLWLRLSAGPSGKSWLENFTFFNLPFHFWFTAQMLPLWFIIICALFNIIIDRLTLKEGRRREGYHD